VPGILSGCRLIASPVVGFGTGLAWAVAPVPGDGVAKAKEPPQTNPAKENAEQGGGA